LSIIVGAQLTPQQLQGIGGLLILHQSTNNNININNNSDTTNIITNNNNVQTDLRRNPSESSSEEKLTPSMVRIGCIRYLNNKYTFSSLDLSLKVNLTFLRVFSLSLNQ